MRKYIWNLTSGYDDKLYIYIDSSREHTSGFKRFYRRKLWILSITHLTFMNMLGGHCIRKLLGYLLENFGYMDIYSKNNILGYEYDTYTTWKKSMRFTTQKAKTGELFRNMVRRQDTLISKRDRQSVVAAPRGAGTSCSRWLAARWRRRSLDVLLRSGRIC